MSSATMLGSDAHLPRQIRSPARRIETAVSFIDTSRPIYSSMAVLHSMLGTASSRAPVSPSYRGTATDSQGRLAPAITPCGRLLHRHESAKEWAPFEG